MIVCHIELWPHGFKANARRLGTIAIANNGTGTLAHGNYDVALSHSGSFIGTDGVWKAGSVQNHDRMQSPYSLVMRALDAALYNRKPNWEVANRMHNHVKEAESTRIVSKNPKKPRKKRKSK